MQGLADYILYKHDLMLCLCRQENKIRVGMTGALFTQNSLILSNI